MESRHLLNLSVQSALDCISENFNFKIFPGKRAPGSPYRTSRRWRSLWALSRPYCHYTIYLSAPSITKFSVRPWCLLENRPVVKFLEIWRYEFYFLVVKTIFYSLAALLRKILFLPLENKIHIFAPPCNILFIFGPPCNILYLYTHTTCPVLVKHCLLCK